MRENVIEKLIVGVVFLTAGSVLVGLGSHSICMGIGCPLIVTGALALVKI